MKNPTNGTAVLKNEVRDSMEAKDTPKATAKRPQPVVAPLGSVVVLVPDKPREVSDGGIELPEVARHAPPTAIVHAVGPEVEAVQVEDRVLVPNYAGVQLVLDDFVFALVKEEDILATVAYPEVADAN